MQERSDTDGRVYNVQYFERAVFEMHPANQRPYDVLLTLLGVYEYSRRYGRSIVAGQRASTINPLRFAETGKTIGGAFREYWERNGGLAQQGFPITDEFQERSETDGKTYTVQYFERAVFELHTENQPPFNVLLSLLGKFRYDQKYNAQGTPRPAVTPTTGTGQLRPGQGRWLTKAAIPTPRSEVAVAEVNGKIYVLGGYSSSRGQAVHEEYDPATDRWRSRANLPKGLNHAGAVGLNGKLYMIGGYSESGGAVADTYVYDPAADRWSALASMPTPRGALGVAEVGGKIYVVGGRNTADVGANEVYDPATDRWGRLAAMPTPRDHLGVAALGGKVYAMGGRFETFARNTGINEVFDPATGRWERRADMPTPRSGIAAVSLAGHVLVFGGEETQGTFEENEAYNPTADAWVALAPMPTARHGIGAAVVSETVYIPSGGPTPGGSQIETHEAFTLSP
jgi:N-acetylneuraminic acid mutarotase